MNLRATPVNALCYPSTIGQMIRQVGDSDPTTRRMPETILAMEEEHADDLADMLAEFGSHARSRSGKTAARKSKSRGRGPG